MLLGGSKIFFNMYPYNCVPKADHYCGFSHQTAHVFVDLHPFSHMYAPSNDLHVSASWIGANGSHHIRCISGTLGLHSASSWRPGKSNLSQIAEDVVDRSVLLVFVPYRKDPEVKDVLVDVTPSNSFGIFMKYTPDPLGGAAYNPTSPAPPVKFRSPDHHVQCTSMHGFCTTVYSLLANYG